MPAGGTVAPAVYQGNSLVEDFEIGEVGDEVRRFTFAEIHTILQPWIHPLEYLGNLSNLALHFRRNSIL